MLEGLISFAILGAPGIVAALVLLVVLNGVLRGGRFAFGAVSGLILLAVLSYGAFAATDRWRAKEHAECEADQAAAALAGEAKLLDCESLGLAFAFPVASIVMALIVFVLGSALMRAVGGRSGHVDAP